jgi:hypothetical protein
MSKSVVHPFVIAVALVTGAVAMGCSVPEVGSSGDEVNTNRNNNRNNNNGDDDGDDNAENNGADLRGEDAAKSCTDQCVVDEKRCSSTSSAGTEVCVKATDGCTRWTQGPDCEIGTQCDGGTNNGTCKQGCSSDPGCSSANVGAKRCSSTGAAELTCTAAGSCFVFRTTRSGIPQECNGQGAFCSSGQRFSCVASPAGACVQHKLQANPCASGSVCSGNSCVATCTNDPGCSAAREGIAECAGTTARRRCARVGSCFEWISTTSCAAGATCANGACTSAPSCTNQCVLHARRCSSTANAKQDCVMANNGCTVWTSTSCASVHVCFDGVCGPP